MDTDPLQQSLLEDVLGAYKSQQREQDERWRDLDKKAQATLSVAGVFVAAGFAFVRQMVPGAMLWEKLSLGASLALLLASIVLCLLSMRVRRAPAPVLGREVETLVRDLLPIDQHEIAERIPRYLQDKIALWRQVTGDVNRMLEKKAKELWRGQLALLAAVFVIAVVAVVTAVTPEVEVSGEMQQERLPERGVGAQQLLH